MSIYKKTMDYLNEDGKGAVAVGAVATIECDELSGLRGPAIKGAFCKMLGAAYDVHVVDVGKHWDLILVEKGSFEPELDVAAVNARNALQMEKVFAFVNGERPPAAAKALKKALSTKPLPGIKPKIATATYVPTTGPALVIVGEAAELDTTTTTTTRELRGHFDGIVAGKRKVSLKSPEKTHSIAVLKAGEDADSWLEILKLLLPLMDLELALNVETDMRGQSAVEPSELLRAIKKTLSERKSVAP